jgi:hypothetical protein
MSQDRELSANVHPLLAIVIVVLVLSIFTLRLEFDRLALAQPVPTHITAFDANQLAVVVDNRIFIGNEHGELNTISLEPLGVQEQIGAIGRFANGDWLLRTGYRENSLLQNLAIYLRQKTPPLQHNEGNGILMRCNESSATCSTFNASLPMFNRTFGLAIAADDTVYIADTSEHRLLKITTSGPSLLEAKSGFNFPNQLLFVGEDLWLVNTNQHELVRIDTSDDHFGRKLETINLLDKGVPRSFDWPFSVTRVEGGWWVLGKRSGARGGAILRFDTDWNFRDMLALPDKTDPAFLYKFGTHILVSDMEHRRVLRFDNAGTALTDLDWPALKKILQQSREQATHYRRLSRLCLAAFIGVLLGGASLVWLQARDLRPAFPGSRQVSLDDVDIHWIDIEPGIKRQFRIVLALFVPIIGAFAYIALATPQRDPVKLASLSVWPAIMMVSVFLIWNRLIKQRIGIKGDTLILVSAKGYAAGSAKQILYTPQHLLIDDIAVSLGQRNKSLFPHEALIHHVFPLLKLARSISIGAMQMQLIRTASPLTVLAWLALIAFGLTTIFIKL